MSKKRRLHENEVVNLTEEFSAVLQKKMPQKLKDSRSFAIPCSIGGSHINTALCDLGASINLMSFFVYRALDLGEMKPTSITLQLADRSIKYPQGVVEDVLIKVDKFIFPADFVILDMEEEHATLGRPFLATADAKIEVNKGELSMGLEGERVIFNIFMKAPNTPIKELCMIEPVVKLEGCQKAVIVVESSREKAPSSPKKKTTKKKSKFKRQYVEYIWRVKEKGNT
ncbi:uncharacterized protein [Henckelia pumila]|uniref:uncharacterized protein n=1 Tax=Henckelia pumila TaxID=405737 RepID=UPI003C6DEE28